MPLSTTVIDISSSSYLGYHYDCGLFFLWGDGEVIENVYTCRDEIGYEWDDNPDHRLLGFSLGSHHPIDARKLATIWNRMEAKLGGINHPSIVHQTSCPGTVILKLSTFWTKYLVRRSAATLLLRMIVIYQLGQGLTQSQAIEAYDLTSKCSRGLKHFLRGFTKPKFDEWNEEYIAWQDRGGWDDDDDPEPYNASDPDGNDGFVSEMHNDRPFDDIKRLMVKP